jgi:hypothetical protein
MPRPAKVSAVFYGRALSAGTVSLDDGSDALRLLMADVVIDFGSAVRGSTVTRHIIVANPSTSDKLSIRNVVALGAAFHLARDPLPIVLAPGASARMQLDFTPMSNGMQQGTLENRPAQFPPDWERHGSLGPPYRRSRWTFRSRRARNKAN